MTGRTPSALLAKVDEEAQELHQAVAEQSNVEEELGDLLFSPSSMPPAIWALTSEQALNRASDKFISRFARMERTPGGLVGKPTAELLDMWRQAKTEERSE